MTESSYVYTLNAALGDYDRGTSLNKLLSSLHPSFEKGSAAWADLTEQLYHIQNEVGLNLSRAGASLALLAQKLIAPQRQPFYCAGSPIHQSLTLVIDGKQHPITSEPKASEEEALDDALYETLSAHFPTLKLVSPTGWDTCWKSVYAPTHQATVRFKDYATNAFWVTAATGRTPGHAFLKALEEGYTFALDPRFVRPGAESFPHRRIKRLEAATLCL